MDETLNALRKIEVENKIKIYETDGVETPIANNDILLIKSHWNRDEFVIIGLPGTKD